MNNPDKIRCYKDTLINKVKKTTLNKNKKICTK